MSDALICWKCGATLASLVVPFIRAAECPTCRTDVHVCKQCKFYDPNAAKHCREPIAEGVSNKERANFCGYFVARMNAYRTHDDSAARAQLDALFGAAPVPEAPSLSPADKAREELERLFGKKP